MSQTGIYMQIRLASHLHRNRCGIYGFRFVIPKLLHVYFPQEEYRFSLKTADKNKAKRLSCRYINLVQFCFERIIHSMNFNEASEHASQLLKSMNIVDFESIIDFVKALAETADDSNKKLASEIININMQVRELDEIRLELVSDFISSIKEVPEEAIDTLVCDFYARAIPLKSEEASLSNQLQSLTLEI